MTTPMFVPQVAVVDFNHHRGPEIEFWVTEEGQALYNTNQWTQLAFLALPDGAHASSEEFSYFTLVTKGLKLTDGSDSQEGTLFGLSCTRQIRSDRLQHKSAEVTRSFVQKAVVVVVDKPSTLGHIREKLAVITAAWFAQEDFSNIDILKEYQSNLKHDAENSRDTKEAHFGLSLRELLHDLRYHTLIVFKFLLLQRRALFFSTRCERLCMTQFALISLIPGLLDHMQGSAAPELEDHSRTISPVVDFRTSDRTSLLAYIGLPLHIFGKNSFFSPYTPLQNLDLLSSPIAQSYVAGSTNVLFLGQRDLPDLPHNPHRYSDILINLDETSISSKVSILEPELRAALSLSAADRRWIDTLTQTVLDTWNPTDPSRPTTYGYAGSEDAIRLAFEEYILSLLSSAAYRNYFDNHPNPYLASSGGAGIQDERYPDPAETANDFNNDFLRLWRQTPNYKLWHSLTADANIFDIVEPRHPTAGGLNIEDVQRRVGVAMSELHVDEKVRQGREQAARALEAGRERAAAGVARFWKEVEGFKERRDASRGRLGSDPAIKSQDSIRPELLVDDIQKGNTASAAETSSAAGSSTVAGSWSVTAAALRDRAARIQVQRPNVNIDTAQIQATARDNAAKAGVYLSSWGSWASQKSKQWQESRSGSRTRQDGVVDDNQLKREDSTVAVTAAKRAADYTGEKVVDK